MRKKLLSLILCLALTLSLAPAALAAGFADVTDTATAQNVEVLRLMGVVEGDDNAVFRPYSSLTRAEFCKMAVVLKGMRSVTARYGSRTVFPDVRGTHWEAGYVNYAASKDAGLIHGMSDGTFQPDRAITYGEAVTILMRQLGYADKDTGGIWPDGYIALAGEAGMTKGLALSGNASITRAQAAKLFVNALTAENDKGETLLKVLGYTADTTKDPVTLWSVDTVNGKLRLSDGTTPEMENPMDSTALTGVKGHVVTNAAGKAVTFLPVKSAAGGTVTDAAIIVSANGSTAGFDALTGGSMNYTIYRNGVRATASALKKNDVVTYNAANNTIQACDTRVVVYYEKCDPSPSAPASIEVLGGTEFSVLPTAQASLAQFRPGKVMTILLTADGQIAGAVENGTGGASGNAFAFVDSKGAVSLICGGNLYGLKCSGSGYEGQVVRVSQTLTGNKSTVYLSKQSNNSTGALDLTTKTLGTRKLADGVLVFSDGALSSLEALGVSRVEQSRIAYARTNSAGEVDLVVIADDSNEMYGRVLVSTTSKEVWVDEDDPSLGTTTEYTTTITLQCPGKADISHISGYQVRTGDFVSTQENRDKSNFYNMVSLTKLSSVPATAWIGDSAVNYGGQTYTVYPKTVICYNRDSGTWFTAASADTTALDAAKAYGGTMDLYVKDGVVRAIEVRS